MQEPKTRKIASVMRQSLLIVAILATIISDLVLWFYQDTVAKKNAARLLELNISDVVADVEDASDKNLTDLAEYVAYAYTSDEIRNEKTLSELREEPEYRDLPDDDLIIRYLSDILDVAELLIIDENGIVIKGNVPDYNGYDMASGSQSAEFLCLLGEKDTYVQEYGPISYNSEVFRKYAGAKLTTGGFVQVAFDAERFQRDIDEDVRTVTQNRHVGESGYIVIANGNGTIISSPNLEKAGKITPDQMKQFQALEEGVPFKAEFGGGKNLCMFFLREGYYITAVIPMREIVNARNTSVIISAIMESIIFAIIFLMEYNAIDVLVIRNLTKVTTALDEIAEGNLDVVVDVRSNREFDSLSNDINETVRFLKEHIAQENIRISQELEYAKNIQKTALPSVFPAFPGRQEFDIFASMDPAKEVGGDFYDFYLIGEDKLGFVVADVSGKGIPAALCMMRAKTLIKSYADSFLSPDRILEAANKDLCENNETGMFVTVWLGILDLKTGHVEFANAGHNPPLVFRQGEGYSYFKVRPGFVLAGLENSRYKNYSMDLTPGDRLFLYTDGVTEAANAENDLFGDARLLSAINCSECATAEETCAFVRSSVDGFVGDVPQFDDITMLSLYFKKRKEE